MRAPRWQVGSGALFLVFGAVAACKREPPRAPQRSEPPAQTAPAPPELAAPPAGAASGGLPMRTLPTVTGAGNVPLEGPFGRHPELAAVSQPLPKLQDEASFAAAVRTLTTPYRGRYLELGSGRAYLALPSKPAPVPAILVLHDGLGMTTATLRWADRLASLGAAALALDLFGGRVATDRLQALALTQTLQPEGVRAAIDAALRLLSEDERILAPRIAAVGWSLGGTWAFDTLVRHPKLAGAAVLEARLPDDPLLASRVKAPLLAIYARRDTVVLPGTVDALSVALAPLGSKARVVRLAGERNFTNPSRSEYAPESAAEAWRSLSAFLVSVLATGR